MSNSKNQTRVAVAVSTALLAAGIGIQFLAKKAAAKQIVKQASDQLIKFYQENPEKKISEKDIDWYFTQAQMSLLTTFPGFVELTEPMKQQIKANLYGTLGYPEN